MLRDWLDQVSCPIGILGFVDGFAALLAHMCAMLGVAVPEEVALIGVHNIIPACEGTIPTLTSIRLDEIGMTDKAIEHLRNLMRGREVPHVTKVQPLGIIARESTDVLAVSNPLVAKCMRYMWGHLRENLSVEDVARFAGISRRSMERAFHDSLGRSVNVELRRKRLEVLKHLLRSTDTNIQDLAPQVGFRSTQYLHRVFRSAFGMSPREYRVSCKGDT